MESKVIKLKVSVTAKHGCDTGTLTFSPSAGREYFDEIPVRVDGVMSTPLIISEVVNSISSTMSTRVRCTECHHFQGECHNYELVVETSCLNPFVRDILVDVGIDEEAVLLEPTYFDEAIRGISVGGRVVYSYDSLCEVVSREHEISIEDAMKFVDVNTIRALPYMGENAPIVMHEFTPFTFDEIKGDSNDGSN